MQNKLPAESTSDHDRYLEDEGKDYAPRASQFVFVIKISWLIGANVGDIEGDDGFLSAHYAQHWPHRLLR